jgi:hypothetical protein
MASARRKEGRQVDADKGAPAHQCPWCAETRPTLKQVLMHMESAHHRRWCDLALYPPTAGGQP